MRKEEKAMNSFSGTTQSKLGYYVYCLCSVVEDKRDVIYIGKGSGNRIFDHENKNFSDFTDKGIIVSKIQAKGGIIERYILDYDIDAAEFTSLKNAFNTENALINLATLMGAKLKNSVAGHGKLKKAVLVEEIENLLSTEMIDISQFKENEKIIIWMYGGSVKNIRNEEKMKNIIQEGFTKDKVIWEPQYILVSYKKVVKYAFKVDTVITSIDNTARKK